MEVSNLRFPHSIHLAQTCEVPATGPGRGQNLPPEVVQGCNVLRMARQRMSQESLDCGDCHRPEPGGVNMLPVRMQDHCAECHRLEFDQNAPERVLPHGRPAEVIAVINDYYIARAALGRPLALEAPPTHPAAAGGGAAPAQPQPQPQAVGPDPRRGGGAGRRPEARRRVRPPAVRRLPRGPPARRQRQRPVGSSPGQGRRAVDAQGGVQPCGAPDHALHRLPSCARIEAELGRPDAGDRRVPDVPSGRARRPPRCRRPASCATTITATGCRRCCRLQPRHRRQRDEHGVRQERTLTGSGRDATPC